MPTSTDCQFIDLPKVIAAASQNLIGQGNGHRGTMLFGGIIGANSTHNRYHQGFGGAKSCQLPRVLHLTAPTRGVAVSTASPANEVHSPQPDPPGIKSHDSQPTTTRK